MGGATPLGDGSHLKPACWPATLTGVSVAGRRRVFRFSGLFLRRISAGFSARSVFCV